MTDLNPDKVKGVAALLVHAAKIDEIYSEQEKKMVEEFIKSYLNNVNTAQMLIEAEELEANSNQLLEFTNIIKKSDNKTKTNIIEHLWKIIISDKKIDQYESNLMRRICGLIYFPDKECAEIKLKLINKK